MVKGRPREHDRDQIAKELIEWAKLPDSINFCGFCAQQLLVPSKLVQWSKEDDYFRQAYDLAKAMLGDKREKMLNAELLHVKAYDLNAKTYDYFLKEEARQQSEFESGLKKNETQQVSEDIIERFETMNRLLSAAQEARKIDDSKSKADAKS